MDILSTNYTKVVLAMSRQDLLQIGIASATTMFFFYYHHNLPSTTCYLYPLSMLNKKIDLKYVYSIFCIFQLNILVIFCKK